MTKTRAPTSIENPKSRSKRPRLESGEQSIEETSDRKGKRREEGGGGDEGIFVIDSDNDVWSSADDVFSSEELQIQEILFMTMQSEKKRENLPLVKEEEQDPQHDHHHFSAASKSNPRCRFRRGSVADHSSARRPPPKDSLTTSLRHRSHLYTQMIILRSDKSKLDPTDQKGKKPTKSPYSKLEPGQSSKVTCAEFLCEICMERVPTIHAFGINPCNHIYCNSCIVNYITSKLDGSNATILCPHPGCKSGSLDLLTCQCILPAATFDKWGRVLCESSLGHNKFYCPFKDCSALLVDEGSEEVRNCECPHCNRMFCAQCKVPWHGDMSCKEFQMIGKDERGQEDLMLIKLAKDKRWQMCPQCRMYVEKIDGCMFMKCRCGYGFCYVCATPMSKETHYCTKCKR